jgi:HEAT repeat protein
VGRGSTGKGEGKIDPRGRTLPGEGEEADEDLLARLIAALDDENPRVWSKALATLRHLGPSAKGAVPALADILRDADRKVQHGPIVHTLAFIGPASVPALIEGVQVEDVKARTCALRILGKFGPKSKEAVPSVAEVLLEDKKSKVRSLAAETLAKIGEEARDAGESLAEALGDKVKAVRKAAAEAFAKIKPTSEEVIDALVDVMENGTEAGRPLAAKALGGIGSGANQAVPNLVEALRSEDAKLRKEAAVALGEMGPAAKDAIQALQEACQDKNPRVRQSARRALPKIEG